MPLSLLLVCLLLKEIHLSQDYDFLTSFKRLSPIPNTDFTNLSHSPDDFSAWPLPDLPSFDDSKLQVSSKTDISFDGQFKKPAPLIKKPKKSSKRKNSEATTLTGKRVKKTAPQEKSITLPTSSDELSLPKLCIFIQDLKLANFYYDPIFKQALFGLKNNTQYLLKDELNSKDGSISSKLHPIIVPWQFDQAIFSGNFLVLRMGTSISLYLLNGSFSKLELICILKDCKIPSLSSIDKIQLSKCFEYLYIWSRSENIFVALHIVSQRLCYINCVTDFYNTGDKVYLLDYRVSPVLTEFNPKTQDFRRVIDLSSCPMMSFCHHRRLVLLREGRFTRFLIGELVMESLVFDNLVALKLSSASETTYFKLLDIRNGLFIHGDLILNRLKLSVPKNAPFDFWRVCDRLLMTFQNGLQLEIFISDLSCAFSPLTFKTSRPVDILEITSSMAKSVEFSSSIDTFKIPLSLGEALRLSTSVPFQNFSKFCFVAERGETDLPSVLFNQSSSELLQYWLLPNLGYRLDALVSLRFDRPAERPSRKFNFENEAILKQFNDMLAVGPSQEEITTLEEHHIVFYSFLVLHSSSHVFAHEHLLSRLIFIMSEDKIRTLVPEFATQFPNVFIQIRFSLRKTT